MAYNRSLISSDDMRTILSIKTLSSDESALLDNHIIPAVSKAVETYCDRNILDAEELTEYYDGTGNSTLQLKQYPINSVTSVKERQTEDYSASGYTKELTEESDYIIESEKGCLWRTDGVWFRAKRMYQVVYRAGYISGDIPPDLLMGIKKWCAIIFQKTQNKLHGVSSHMFGDEMMTYEMDGMPKEVEVYLKPYMRLPYA